MKISLLYKCMTFTFATLLLIVPANAQAQGNDRAIEKNKWPPEDAIAARSDDQFVIIPANQGWLRMERKTGQITLCKKSNAVNEAFTCRLQADERLAYDAEIARLEARLSQFQKHIAQFDDTPSKQSQEKTAEKEDKSNNLLTMPSEQDVDSFMNFAENLFRRFLNMVETLKQEQTSPDQT